MILSDMPCVQDVICEVSFSCILCIRMPWLLEKCTFRNHPNGLNVLKKQLSQQTINATNTQTRYKFNKIHLNSSTNGQIFWMLTC